MTDLFDALGMEQSATYKGKTYRMAPVRQLEVVAAWEEWLGDLAIEFFERRAAKIGPAALDRAYRALAAQAAEGAFDYLGPTSMAKLATIEGKKKMAFFRIRATMPNVEESEIAEMVEAEINTIVNVMMREDAAEEERLKNDESPAAEAGENSSGSTGDSSSPSSSTEATAPSPPIESAS